MKQQQPCRMVIEPQHLSSRPSRNAQPEEPWGWRHFREAVNELVFGLTLMRAQIAEAWLRDDDRSVLVQMKETAIRCCILSQASVFPHVRLSRAWHTRSGQKEHLLFINRTVQQNLLVSFCTRLFY
jgi:hypothetical protein